jgi:hypothetical protein
MIFTGGVNATVVRAVVEHVFDKSGKVFPLSFEAWDKWYKLNPCPIEAKKPVTD